MISHERALAATLRRLRLPRGAEWHPDTAAHLAEWLYQHLFIDWRPPSRARSDLSGSPWFVAELIARTARATWLEPGFTVTERTADGAFVSNGHIRLWVADQRSLTPHDAVTGEHVSVRVPCAREAALAGFFTVVSRKGRLEPDAPHLKLYLNVTPGGAIALMEGLVTSPALARARFEAKTANDPEHFGRRDTALLYVDPRDVARVVAWLRAFAARRPRALRDGVPPLTLELFRGVAIAESPTMSDESFGAHRCRLIAEGLVTSRREARDWRETVAQRFDREGLDWQRPWLGELPPVWASRVASTPRSRRTGR